MFKIRTALALMAVFSAQVLAADLAVESAGKPCGVVAKTCLAAGFTRDEGAAKPFWDGCMKPVLMGQSVEGVTIDAAVVQNCRVDKVSELKKELEDIQSSMSKAS